MKKHLLLWLELVLLLLGGVHAVHAQEPPPRLFLENPGDCYAPDTTTEMLMNTATGWAFSFADTAGYNTWVELPANEAFEFEYIYICPPQDSTTRTLHIAYSSVQHGQYRNEAEFYFIKDSYLPFSVDEVLGGGCGGYTLDQVADVQIPAPGDPHPELRPYEVRVDVRSYSKRDCDASVTLDFSIDVVGYLPPTPTPTVTPTPAPTPTPNPCPGGFCSPLATPTPPDPLPLPDPLSINDHPHGCDGTELIATYEYLNPGDIWGTGMVWSNTPFNVRFTFAAHEDDDIQARIYANSHENTVRILGPSDGETQFYETFLPVSWGVITSTFVDVEVENQDDAEDLVLVSVCVQDVEMDPGCVNADPGLNYPHSSGWGWHTTGSAFIQNGLAHLEDPRTTVYQVQHDLPAGIYNIAIDMFALAPGPIPVQIRANTISETTILPTDTAARYSYSGVLVPDTVFTIRAPNNHRFGTTIRVSRVCIQEVNVFPEPTPEPTPEFPTDPSACLNPDAGFNLPGAWWLMGTTRIDDSVLSLGSNGHVASIDLAPALAPGHYYLQLNARALPDAGGKAKHIRVDLLNYDGYIHSYFAMLNPDGEWLSYTSSRFEIEEPVVSFGVVGDTYMPGLQSVPPLADVFAQVAFICVTATEPPVATPSPVPTFPNPGDPTATSTPLLPPPPPPVNCVKPDPGIDTGTHWTTFGGGVIQESVATLPPGAQLVLNFAAPDPTHDYAVHIVSRCAYPASGDMYWRGDEQTVMCLNPGYIETTYIFRRAGQQILSAPLTGLLDDADAWSPSTFISPLSAPELERAVQQDQQIADYNLTLSDNLFSLAIQPTSYGTLEVQSVCIRDNGVASAPPVEPDDVELFHPVCERDWAIQRQWNDNAFAQFHAMLIGPGARPGMPVHAPYHGLVTSVNVTYTFGSDAEFSTYNHCVRIDHSSQFNLPVYSVICNLGTFTIPASRIVPRGTLLGYTSDYAGDNGLRGDGLAVIALQINDEWVDPNDHYNGYVDCRPYEVIMEELETCTTDDGSDLIPPRYNPPSPSFWEANEWAPWLAKKTYDTIGYPILCTLVRLWNWLIDVIESVVNALLRSLAPALMFIYRISRLFEHVLDVLATLWHEFNNVLTAWRDVAICLRSVLGYFIAAISDAINAEIIINDDATEFQVFVIKMVVFVINQTVLAWLLGIAVGLLISGTAWRLVPWGLRKLRQAIGMGEG